MIKLKKLKNYPMTYQQNLKVYKDERLLFYLLFNL